MNATIVSEENIQILKNSQRIIEDNENLIEIIKKKYIDCDFDEFLENLLKVEKLQKKNKKLQKKIKKIINKI